MNFDSAISFLGQFNWGFLLVWLVVLAVAFMASFPERPSTSAPDGPGRRHP